MKTIRHESQQADQLYPGNQGIPKPDDSQYTQAQAAALRFLAHRSRSEAEVRRRLESSHTEDIVSQVIHWLKDKRYLNDAKFAEAWRLSREARHPRGEVLIRQELSKLGVDRNVVDAALEGFDAAENAYRAAQKPASRLKGAGYVRFKQRLWGYLNRRGFKADVIAQTIQRLWDELTDPLTDPLNGHVDADSHNQQSEEESDAYQAEWRDEPAD